MRGLLHVFIACSFLCFSSIAATQSSDESSIVIPNSDYLEALEYSCMKHILAKRVFRALEVLNVMNWQCAEKQGLVVKRSSDKDELYRHLAEARKVKSDFLKSKKEQWVCRPKPMLTQIKKDFYSGVGKKVFDYLVSKGMNPEIANIIVAQMAQETAWGTRVMGNNYFNVKGSYQGESVRFQTSEEYVAGKWTKVVDDFRKYPNVEASVDDYLKVLSEKWPRSYQTAFAKNSKIPVASFILGLNIGLKGGYATDRRYASKLELLGDQVQFEMSGGVLPTYLKCLGREGEINQ